MIADKKGPNWIWNTTGEEAIIIDGKVASWRTMDAWNPDERGKLEFVGGWVEIGTQKGKMRLPESLFFRLHDKIHASLFPDGKPRGSPVPPKVEATA